MIWPAWRNPAPQQSRHTKRGMGRRGLLFVVSAPSGAGKTTLCKEVVSSVPGLWHSVSYTTRKPRPGEQDGREYRFVDEKAFQDMVQRNEFVEWAQVHGHFYGTPRTMLSDKLESGSDVLLEIDVQGAKQVRKKHADAVFIFILPPSLEALESRLAERGGDTPDEIQRRMQKAREEVWSYREYYYIVINADFKQACKELESIIFAERTKTKCLDMGWLEENFIREREQRPKRKPAGGSA